MVSQIKHVKTVLLEKSQIIGKLIPKDIEPILTRAWVIN